MLGLLAHSSLAVGLVVIGFLTFIRFDIMGLLFGDILAVNKKDLVNYMGWWSLNFIGFKINMETIVRLNCKL